MVSFLIDANLRRYSGIRILPWESICTSIAPASINLANARLFCCEIGRLDSLSTSFFHSSWVYTKRQLSNPFVTIAPFFKSCRNLAGIAILPLVSIVCLYSPMNIGIYYWWGSPPLIPTPYHYDDIIHHSCNFTQPLSRHYLRTSYAQYKKATLIIQVAFAYSKHQKHFSASWSD